MKHDCTLGLSAKYMVVYHPAGFPLNENEQYFYHYMAMAKGQFNIIKDIIVMNGGGVVSIYDIKKDVLLYRYRIPT